MSEPLLELRSIRKAYALGRSVVTVFEDVSATVGVAELVTIRGASGTGKSTLLHLMGGLDRPDAGQIRWLGDDLQNWNPARVADWRRNQLGLVFQSYQLLPELSALENVELPAMIGGTSVPGPAADLLQRVGLGERLDHRPAELSGGEQQRVAIARALRNGPRLVLADEPTGNLDRATGEKVMALLIELCLEQAATLVLATHDPELASRGNRQWILSEGTLREA